MENSNYKNKTIENKNSNTSPLGKNVGCFKDKAISLKKNTPKQTVHEREKKLSKPKTQKWIFFYAKKKEKEEKTRKKEIKFRIIKDKIIKDIRTLFKQEDYYKLIRVGNFWNNSFVEYKSNGDRNKRLLPEKYKIKPYLKDIIIHLQESDTQKTQLTIAISFISPNNVEKSS